MLVSGIKQMRKQLKEEYSACKAQPHEPPVAYCTEFLKVLALCNTVLIDKDAKAQNEEPYKASSPDELALVKGAKLVGLQLVSRSHNRVTIFNMVTKVHETFKVIAEFPFDSVRKRMSVILKDE